MLYCFCLSNFLFYSLENILNVCDLRLGQTILDNFNVIKISMPDEPQIDIKQVTLISNANNTRISNSHILAF